MGLKRILTAVIGLPIVILFILFGNKYIMDIIFAVISCIAMYEYSNCIKNEAKFMSIIGYIVASSIAFIHIVPTEVLNFAITLGVPIILLCLFFVVIVTNMKYTYKDLAYSFVGIMYIVCFTGFIPLIYGLDENIPGKYLIWFVLSCAWGCDSLAYIVGVKLGKHKFSKVSPNKSIEGCIGGIFGAVIFSLIFSLIFNKYFNCEISYLTISIISIILSVIGQIGDFSASSIKRYFGIKDYSELFPGHGGMLDRIDSVMFIAPFAYFLLTMFL